MGQQCLPTYSWSALGQCSLLDSYTLNHALLPRQPTCSAPDLSDPAYSNIHPQLDGDHTSLRAMLSVPTGRCQGLQK